MSQTHINTKEIPMPRSFTAAIVERVAAAHGVTAQDIYDGRRFRKIMLARREAIVEVHLANPCMSYPQLGKALGGLDHTSVLHALQMAGVYQPQITRRARAASMVGRFIANYEAVADMKEHAACCALARAFARLSLIEGGAE